MAAFIRNGNRFSVTADANIDLHYTLPVGNYAVKFDSFRNQYYLEQVEQFAAASKVYGDCTKNADRIVTTFNSREASTGVLLTGEKGSGKTLLARQLSIRLASLGVPTLIINEEFSGDEFNQFVQSITQPTVILFDEFEKVYSPAGQERILTLLDGVYPTKKLFVFTCNDSHQVDSHLRNRPGRIYYMIEFNGLAAEFIREYCVDNLDDQSQVENVVNIGGLFEEFNFDMLKALVEEMNRYSETASEAIKMLNAKPTTNTCSQYTVTLINKDNVSVGLENDRFHGNPLSYRVLNVYATSYEESGISVDPVEFSNNDLIKVDPATGTLVFRNADGFVASFTRIKYDPFSKFAF